MRIGIDARLIEETGVGRYIRNLIAELSVLDTTNRYVVFLRKKSVDSFVLPNSRWTKVAADVRWHTLTEQIVMPKFFAHERLDLVHIPYHNPPIFYSKPMVVTIHDLTLLHFATGKATTLPFPLYQLKRLGYFIALEIGLRRAKAVITVSEATKRELMKYFGFVAHKTSVTYESADVDFVKASAKQTKPMIKKPYVLYVGNAYPHKNLDTLLSAWKKIADGSLVMVTPDDYFSRQLSQKIVTYGLSDSVTIMHVADQVTLINVYTHATALVFPSYMEGFGLPGVEAMAVGIPVVCSDIPVFREIYKDACLLFDPHDPSDMASSIGTIMQRADIRRNLIQKGKKQVSRYSWRRMAEHTLKIYTAAK